MSCLIFTCSLFSPKSWLTDTLIVSRWLGSYRQTRIDARKRIMTNSIGSRNRGDKNKLRLNKVPSSKTNNDARRKRRKEIVSSCKGSNRLIGPNVKLESAGNVIEPGGEANR